MTHFPKFHYKIKYLLICYCNLMGKRTKKLALKPKKKIGKKLNKTWCCNKLKHLVMK